MGDSVTLANMSTPPVSENACGITLTGFEGPEKKIELDFMAKKGTHLSSFGFRLVSNERWQRILDEAHCTIINSMCTIDFNSYLLSESSLFVYPTKVMLKTCGTTSLLLAIPKILALADELDLELEFFCFSRRNFLFPDEQPAPHTSFPEEVSYLNKLFDGYAYTLGPISHDHWLLYIYDNTTRPDAHLHDNDLTLEVMMVELDGDVMKNFYPGERTEVELTRHLGFDLLLEHSTLSEHLFEPCGYSCNGHSGEAYFTIHITPEPHCSYVSFETNAILPSYQKLLEQIIATLKPGRFSITLFADDKALSKVNKKVLLDFEGFKATLKSKTSFGAHSSVIMGNYNKITSS